MTDMKAPTIDRPRPRRARGQDRPTYLAPDLDRIMIMVTGLMAEMSALRERVDTHEALAERGQVATSDAVERYELDAVRRAARDARRDAMLGRVLRVLYEERDGDRPNDPVSDAG